MLEQYLHAYMNYQQDNWARLLLIAEYAYNNAVNASTGLRPFKALMGYNPDFDIEIFQGPKPASQNAQKRIEELDALRRQLQASWEQARNAQKKYYNKKHLKKSFDIGNWVYLAAKNIITRWPSNKLNLKFIGPFTILEPIGSYAYRLKLPTNFKNIYPVRNLDHMTLISHMTCCSRDPDSMWVRFRKAGPKGQCPQLEPKHQQDTVGVKG